ncbi:hypothetical protein N7495_007561 [Penicillium taxi]|uniref:uncharacterized protein n=1 Tax=Penicillium taxi TaxID=168475 RepID=UPI0025456A51|nr:uncharacterized protein N7495_007561 [Penicillium taxi]KAJ5887520.1 hypothetical protein N7495_007561 [Penicillium taxi]
MAGETGPIEATKTLAMVIAGLFSLAIFMGLEIIFLIFTTFRRRNGLYFWSMLISAMGIILHTLCAFLRYFSLAPNIPMCVLICIGWYAMVTGQSVVLYSRLHLVTTVDRDYRWILYMIVFNFCALHIPTTILFFGSNLGVKSFVKPFNIYERFQLTAFTVQETIISALYIWETLTELRPVLILKGSCGQRVIRNVILVNIIAILLDASLLVVEFTNHFPVQTTYKPVVYALKLKMEFMVLNTLLAVIRKDPPTIEAHEMREENISSMPGSKWSSNNRASEMDMSHIPSSSESSVPIRFNRESV